MPYLIQRAQNLATDTKDEFKAIQSVIKRSICQVDIKRLEGIRWSLDKVVDAVENRTREDTSPGIEMKDEPNCAQIGIQLM